MSRIEATYVCLWEDRETRKNNFTKEKRETQKKLKRLDDMDLS